MELTMGSLFDGIGGFPLAFGRHGFTSKWSVEIDGDCAKVLNRHWPDVPKFLDVKDVGGHNLPNVDVITGGTPCQDLSVAGKRAGLEGARSGLFYEFIRVCDELKPQMILWENVPGALSSNGGADFQVVLDAFESLGYIVDFDILDAQFFGVPQRRRRVFIACQSVESLLQQKTTMSALTIAQCLIEILHGILIEARSPSRSGWRSSDSSNNTSSDGLQRRMKLFGLNRLERWMICAEHLDAEDRRSWSESGSSDFPIASSAEGIDSIGTGTLSETLHATTTGNGFGERSTEQSWKSDLDALSSLVRSFTTSQETSSTTEETIFTCSRTLLRIASLISRSNHSCPSYWSAESSALTALKDVTNYARKTSSDLFSEVDWVQSWVHLIREAEDTLIALSNTPGERAGEVLFEPEGGSGDPAESREARAELATDVAASLKHGGGNGRRDNSDTVGTLAVNAGPNSHDAGNFHCNQAVDAGYIIPIKKGEESSVKSGDDSGFVADGFHTTGAGYWQDGAGCLSASDDNGSNRVVVGFSSKDHGGDAQEELAPTMRSMNYDQSHLNGGGQLAVAFTVHGARSASMTGPGDGDAALETDTARTLDSTGGYTSNQGGNVVAFAENQRGEIRTSDVHPQLTTGGGKPGQGYPAVMVEDGPQVFESRVARNGRGAPSNIVPPLKAQSGQTGKGDAAPLVLSVNHDSKGYDGTNKGVPDAQTDEADTTEILRILREKAGATAFAEWGVARLDELFEAKVLRPRVHGEGLHWKDTERRGVIGGTPPGSEADPAWPMREVWVSECSRRTSQEWGLDGSEFEQLGASLSKLSQPGAPQAEALHDLWRAAEGLGVLREALSTLQETWRPIEGGVAGQEALLGDGLLGDGERQDALRSSLRAAQESGDSSEVKQKGVAGWGVRRLTPL